jgi:hypothetical protein
MTTHGSVAKSMRERIEKLTDERDALGKEMLARLMEQSILFNKERDALRAEVAQRVPQYEEVAALRAERDAMVEEAADELCASIKAALMDEMHDHALDYEDYKRFADAAQRSKENATYWRAEHDVMKASRDSWQTLYRCEFKRAAEAQAERDALRAEVARLRQAAGDRRMRQEVDR